MHRIQESEAKFRALYENAVEGIYQSTLDGRFMAANPAMASMLGYDSPEDLITSITDIGAQFYDIQSRDRLQAILKGA